MISSCQKFSPREAGQRQSTLMTDVVQPSLPYRIEAYPVPRETIAAQTSFVGAMNLSLSLCNFKSDKQAADKLDIDPGLLSSRKQGTKPWQVDDMRKVIEYGQHAAPLAWLGHQYGLGLVVLETEAERRERSHLERIAQLESENRVLINAIRGTTP